MHVDLFYELSVPRHLGRSEREVFEETLQELAFAEQYGFSTAWLVEHHFMPEYSHSSAPDLFLAAAAQRTGRLRLGHAVIPLPYTHPVHVAERLATLDILSGGRVEFGYGRGFSPHEYAAFGLDMAESRSLTEEALAVIRLAFSAAPVNHCGRHFRLQDLSIVPTVVQRPHPPIWSAAVSPESFELAARAAVGVLAGPFKPWFMVREDIRRYRSVWRAAHGDAPAPPGRNSRVGMTVGVYCLEDGQRARRLARAPLEWFYRQLLRQTRPVLQQLFRGYEHYRRIGRLGGLLDLTTNLTALETLGMAIVGDPAYCIGRLQALAAAGVDHVLCAIGAGAMPSADVRECIRVLGESVLPHLGVPAPEDTQAGA